MTAAKNSFFVLILKHFKSNESAHYILYTVKLKSKTYISQGYTFHLRVDEFHCCHASQVEINEKVTRNKTQRMNLYGMIKIYFLSNFEGEIGKIVL